MMIFIYRFTWFQWFVLGVTLLIAAGMAGLAFGYASGSRDREENLALAIDVDIQTQYDLGLKDFEDGKYALAQQRFEYVLQQDPNFPGVVDMLSGTMIQLSKPVTQVTDVLSATPMPSPTPNTRQADELYIQAEQQFRDQAWKNLVKTILLLRDIDPQYRTREVDRMLFLGLRFGGIQKIMEDGNLEGGLYDLALVERFVPLDSQARIYQEWARLYQIGVSFWGVLPEKSIYYFSQLASAAPYLHDFSGIYAKDRYRMALLQYGDQLSQAGDWCLAFEQYKLSHTLLDDQKLQPTLIFAEEQCLFGKETPPLTPEAENIWTATMTLSPTIMVTLDVTPAPTIDTTLTPAPAEATPEPSPTVIESTETPVPLLTATESEEIQTPTPTPEAAP